MNKILVVVDMQNDFIDQALGTKEAMEIVDNVIAKIRGFEGKVYATRDTHPSNYLNTQEGKFLPIEHCIKGSKGWEIRDDVAKVLEEKEAVIVDKPSFGSLELAQLIKKENPKAIELVGLCTDICVVSNAIILKANMPEVPISVDAKCCAGVTVEKHNAALDTMESCQIIVENRE